MHDLLQEDKDFDWIITSYYSSWPPWVPGWKVTLCQRLGCRASGSFDFLSIIAYFLSVFEHSGCHFSNLQETSNGCLLELELEKRISPRLRTLEGWTKIEIGLTRSLLNSGSIVLCQTKGFLSETLNVTPSPHSHGHQLVLLFLSFLIHLFHCVWK